MVLNGRLWIFGVKLFGDTEIINYTVVLIYIVLYQT